MEKVINVEIFKVDMRFVGNFFQANEGLVTKNSGAAPSGLGNGIRRSG